MTFPPLPVRSPALVLSHILALVLAGALPALASAQVDRFSMPGSIGGMYLRAPFDSMFSVAVPGYRPFQPGFHARASDCDFIGPDWSAGSGRYYPGERDIAWPGGAALPPGAFEMQRYQPDPMAYNPFDFDASDEIERMGHGARGGRRGMGGGYGGVYGRFGGLCGMDARQAMARAHIARNDRTWSDGMAAFARGEYAFALEQFNKGYRKLGNPGHGYMAGLILYNGHGMPRDPAKGIHMFDRVALSREAYYATLRFNPAQPERTNRTIDATLALANIYLRGADVPVDRKRALKLFERAADLGYMPAKLTMARLLTEGPHEKRNVRRAASLLEDAAEYGYAPAQYALAQLLERGDGVRPDALKAFGWYQQAAFNPADHSRKAFAQYALGRMYDSGVGAARDPARALAFYRLAAKAGHAEALGALADYLYRGELVDQDLPKARQLYQAAAERGNPDAMSNLAAVLYRGEGGQADPEQAYSWLLVADKAGHPGAAEAAKAVQASLAPEQRARVEAKLLPVLHK